VLMFLSIPHFRIHTNLTSRLKDNIDLFQFLILGYL